MNAKLPLLGLTGILFCLPASAQALLSNSLEDSACYFKTTQGFVMNLNSICGASQPKNLEKSPQSSPSNVQVITPPPILLNPEFRPIAGANPSNPFGRNPNSNPNQCFIVDSNGDRCNAKP